MPLTLEQLTDETNKAIDEYSDRLRKEGKSEEEISNIINEGMASFGRAMFTHNFREGAKTDL